MSLGSQKGGLEPPSSLPEVLVPAGPCCVVEPWWDQLATLLHHRIDTHPLGCHRPRIPDRLVVDKLVHALVYEVGYARVAQCAGPPRSVTDATNALACVSDEPKNLPLESYDRMVDLEVDRVTARCVASPMPRVAAWGARNSRGTGANREPNDRCSPTAAVSPGLRGRAANQRNSVLLRPTLEELGRFETTLGVVCARGITVHLHAGLRQCEDP